MQNMPSEETTEDEKATVHTMAESKTLKTIMSLCLYDNKVK